MTAPVDRPAADGMLERELALATWAARSSFAGGQWSLERLLELKCETVSVVLPAREVADTIGSVLAALVPFRDAGLVEEIVVVNAASEDATAAVASAQGAAVLQESEILADFGPAQGKGDAMWRGLAATSGELVVYIDTDTRDFDAGFLTGMLGPLLERPELEFVKGAFRRPFKVDGAAAVPDGGGRVTELVARPLLNLFMPELAGFGQPLAGETAARRPLLESLSYPVGYGVEIAMMIDVARRVGVESMAQVDLGTRQNRHQPLRDLSAMAYAVLETASRRFTDGDPVAGDPARRAIGLPGPDGLELREVALEERPPLDSLAPEVRSTPRDAVGSPERPAGAVGSAAREPFPAPETGSLSDPRMQVGVPKEIVDGERRVALVPEGVAKLRDRGIEVLVEAGAGRDFHPDAAYEEAGARIVAEATELWYEADLIAKVRAPTTEEVAHAHDGQLVLCFLPPAPSAELVAALAERGVTAVSMDAIPRIARAQSMDALSSQSSVAGYKAVLIGADAFGKYLPMMTTAAGTTKAAKVLVLGAGVAGLQAIATARRLGADVSAFDIRPEVKEQIESLGASFVEEKRERRAPAEVAPEPQGPRPGLAGLWDELKLAFGISGDGDGKEAGADGSGASEDGGEPGSEDGGGSAQTGGYAREQAEEKQRRDRELIKRVLEETDIAITTALIPGRPAPTLITTEMVEVMPPGSVVVDLAAESGGNCELTRAGEIVEHGQVRVIGPRDVPSGLPIHASQLYSRNVVNLLSHLVDDDGELRLDFEDEITDGAVVCHGGEIRHEAVREALGQTAGTSA